ncbi:BsuPI-related putative proteinase inhibitor [Virgibacillus siamensis]|uniref:BsuPI-related putative proteinase inhibitor n=1 Tax=Virgibacillus siamensis TaxID=480071 RepID=UPI001115A643|nr:BsuPI-related putative proteinase inhibitor [Virgibacillus siamensis]
MPWSRMLLLIVAGIAVIALTACGRSDQSHSGEKQNEPPTKGENSGGIVAGKIVPSITIGKEQAIFKLKNQTEHIKKFKFATDPAYSIEITDNTGKVVFEKTVAINDKAIKLKQAEETSFEFKLPDQLQKGTYTIQASLNSNPEIQVKKEWHKT